MANEIRLRANNISGTITNNPLAIGGTSISSPGFVDLPVVDTTNSLVLILDPLESAGQAEIVLVTAHSAAASTVTVTRGYETTTPRQHNLGTTWFHGPVVSDFNFTDRNALSTNRPTATFPGQMIYEGDTGRWTSRSAAGNWIPSPHNPPMCRVRHSANVAIPDNSLTLVTAFDTEQFDTDNMHSLAVNTGRITINTAGVYHFMFMAHIGGATDFNHTEANIRINGGITVASGPGHGPSGGASFEAVVLVETLWKCIVGDYFEVIVYQDNAANVARNLLSFDSYSPVFSAMWVGVG